MSSPRRKLLRNLAAILLLTGAAAFLLLRPPPAAVIEPVRRDVVELVVASGRLRAVRESQVGAETAGVVESLAASEGDNVHQGQLLGRLRLGETDARLQQAKAAYETSQRDLQAQEATLEKLRRELQRTREVAERKLVSRAELDRAQADFDVQAANMESSRARLRQSQAAVDTIRPEFGKREVHAPFDGIIAKRLVEPGQAVTSSTAWFAVAEMGSTELYVETDENNLGKLRVGQSAIAVSPAYPDQPFKATLTQIGPNVDNDRGVVGLRLTPTTLPAFSLPNMTVDVNIETRRADQAFALPVSAVSINSDPPYVLEVAENGRLRKRAVEIIGRNPDWVALENVPAAMRVLSDVTSFGAGARIRPEDLGSADTQAPLPRGALAARGP